MSIAIEVVCARCRHVWRPTRSDYVRGTWKVCERCRDGPEPPYDGRNERTEPTLQPKPDRTE